jgi:pantoate ligase/cytidylate kinase
MGALHVGHASLIRRAISENDVVVVSIFVNPLQFGPTEDLNQYPRQLEVDCQLCEELGVDVVFAPSSEEMGATGDTNSILATSVIPPAKMTAVLCGPFRPGHFTGVATIVTKLLNIVRPDVAYFGEKDAQQLAIIRRVVEDLNLSVVIKGCTTVRESSGLALSSRNKYFTVAEKEQSLVLSRSLFLAKQAFWQGEKNSSKLIDIVKQELTSLPSVKVQYVELVHPQTMEPLSRVDEEGLLALAVYIGKTRAIDNVILHNRQPIVAIDGPAGAGKSTVTRLVAEALGLLYLDTGAMYRAVTWLAMQKNLASDNEREIAQLLENHQLELFAATYPDPIRVSIGGEDVTEAIRTPEVTANVSAIASLGAVRRKLVELQQSWGKTGGTIAEGRDIGTHVFPDAELKIFLTASVAERAKRRMSDLQAKGFENIDLEELRSAIEERDYRDSHRQIAPLEKASDAIEVNTDGLSIEAVTQKIIALYRTRMNFSLT